MYNVIQNLAAAGYETHSYFAAARQVNEQFATVSREKAIMVMNDLFGFNVDVADDVTAGIALRYMIAESIKMHVEGFNVTKEDVESFGTEKPKKFFAEHPWMDPKFAGELKDNPTAVEIIDVPTEDIMITRTNVGGKVIKPKKGLKQEAAKKIYDANRGAENPVIIGLFMSQLDMSKAGATTYLYNMKKSSGDIEVGAKKGRKPKSK